MMMSDLPRDLVEEILARVPATSLKRLRSTCKRWNTLFKKRRFTQKHFRKAPKESMVLMLKEYRVCPIDVKLNVASPSVAFQGALSLKDSHSSSEQVEINEVFHCDGLLLCPTKDNRLVVWNPCLGETKWIQRETGHKKYSRFALGYENNKSCRSYKILSCWGCYNDELDYRELGFEIYNFSSDSWQVLDDVSPDCFPSANGVSLKGNTYWLRWFDEKYFILSFDFTTKRFKHFNFPPFLSHGCMALSVVGDEQLSVLQQIDETSKMEIFVTKKVDNEAALLWSKSFIVELPNGGNCSDVLSSLLIDEEKKVALCCTLDDVDKTGRNLVYALGEDNGYYSQIPYVESTNKPWWEDIDHSATKSWWFPFIFNYVPSLVQIL